MGSLPPAFQAGLTQLIKAGQRGSDPELYSDLIIDQLEEPRHYQVLKAILTDPAWCVKLFGDDQRIAPILPWLEQVRQSLLAYESGGISSAEAADSHPGAPVRPGAGLDSNPPVPGGG